MYSQKKEACPVKKSLDLLSGKWKLRIVEEMRRESRRFGELKKRIDGISEKMLIQELKYLTEQGLLHRKAYPEIPPKVEYSLTDRGRETLPIIDQLIHFGKGILDDK